VKLAVSVPVPEMDTGFTSRALPQAEFLAETGLVPGFVQVTEIVGPVVDPAIAPSPTLQVQPVGLGVQAPVALAVKL
jgi:hypothetical protein